MIALWHDTSTHVQNDECTAWYTRVHGQLTTACPSLLATMRSAMQLLSHAGGEGIGVTWSPLIDAV